MSQRSYNVYQIWRVRSTVVLRKRTAAELRPPLLIFFAVRPAQPGCLVTVAYGLRLPLSVRGAFFVCCCEIFFLVVGHRAVPSLIFNVLAGSHVSGSVRVARTKIPDKVI